MTAPLTDEQFQRIARALTDPTRYEILRRIYASPESINCGESCAGLPIAPATVSHHLRELELAGLIHVEKDGRFKRLSPCRGSWEAYKGRLNEL